MELTYTATTEQIANTARRNAKRRNVEMFRNAHMRKTRARSAARRLERSITKGGEMPDPSIVGLYRKLRAIGERRVVGSNWGQPRHGRRW